MSGPGTRRVLANDQVQVGVIPGLGAKLDSLLHLDSGREWLLAPAGPLPEQHEYGSAFTGTVLCGWDEMLPTIDACRYPAEPYEDVELPDHGEVWALPWQVPQSSATSLTCAVEGRALPYRLRRSVSLDGPAVVLCYSLAAEGNEDLALLWSPHPQFTVHPGTVLRLPPTVDQLTAVVQWAHGDDVHHVAAGDPGLDCTRIVPPGQDIMLYLRPEAHADWAELRDRDGCWLRMSWDNQHLPYLAVWIDHGRYSPAVVCPEPMSGFYDHLGRAYHDGKILTVTPGRPVEWSVRVTLGRS